MSRLIYLCTTQNTTKYVCVYVCDTQHCVPIIKRMYGLCTRAMLVHTTTCKHVDIDNGALSAHLFRCMFSRMPLSSLGLTFKSLLVDLERIYKTLLVMS